MRRSRPNAGANDHVHRQLNVLRWCGHIPIEVLFSPLAVAGFVTGVVVALLAGRVRRDPAPVIAMSAIGSGIALAGLAWANAYGGAALFAAAAVGFGASLWAIGNERARRPTIR